MPEDMPLKEKLYGDLAALRRTAAFVRGAGVSVYLSRHGRFAIASHTHFLNDRECEDSQPRLITLTENSALAMNEQVFPLNLGFKVLGAVDVGGHTVFWLPHTKVN